MADVRPKNRNKAESIRALALAHVHTVLKKRAKIMPLTNREKFQNMPMVSANKSKPWLKDPLLREEEFASTVVRK